MKVDDEGCDEGCGEGCGEGSGEGSDEGVMKVRWKCDESVMKVWRCDEGCGEGNWFDDRQTD